MPVCVQFYKEDTVENHTGMKNLYVLKMGVFIMSGLLLHMAE